MELRTEAVERDLRGTGGVVADRRRAGPGQSGRDWYLTDSPRPRPSHRPPALQRPSPRLPSVRAAPSALLVRICGDPRSQRPGCGTGGRGTVSTVTEPGRADHRANPPGTTFWLARGCPSVRPPSVQPGGAEGRQHLPRCARSDHDGQRINLYAFTGYANEVTIQHLTVQNFGKPRGTNDEGVVNRNLGTGWVIETTPVWKNSGRGHVRQPQPGPAQLPGRQRPVRLQRLPPGRHYRDHVERQQIARNNTTTGRCSGLGAAQRCGKFWAVGRRGGPGQLGRHNKSAGLGRTPTTAGFTTRQLHLRQRTRRASSTRRATTRDPEQHVPPQRPGQGPTTRASRSARSTCPSRAATAECRATTGSRSRSATTCSATTGPASSCGRTPAGSPARPPT